MNTPTHSLHRILALAALVTGHALVAQETKPAAAPAPAARRAQTPPIVSPQVNADRTATFRVRAPKATEVSVSGEWPKGNTPMTKGEDGVWSVTVGPLEPDLYGYSLVIDGFRTIDPANSQVKPMRSPTTSILDVPGATPLAHDFQAVPHGTVRMHTYDSKTLGRKRGLQVYTPPGYDKSSGKYPALYLFHGSGDNEATWVALGKAHLIADNLMAQKNARPMIIVMTDGHAVVGGGGNGAFTDNTQAFEADLLKDVMPFVEANYRVKKGPENRAIIGLSMGGGQSLTVGLNHLELFSWVGGMSSAVRNPEQTVGKALANSKETNSKLKLFWFACGKDDFLLKNNQDFSALLTKDGVRHSFVLTEGNHSWPVWRRYLVDFLPKLFN